MTFAFWIIFSTQGNYGVVEKHIIYIKNKTEKVKIFGPKRIIYSEFITSDICSRLFYH